MVKARRWTEEDLKGIDPHQASVKVGKGRYGNVSKPVVDGIKFDSKREMLRYLDLRILERVEDIFDLQVHPKYPITIGGIPIMVSSNQHNKWDRHLTYEADFEYIQDGDVVIEDVKMESGHRTGIYKLKRALMRAMGHTIKEY